MITVSCTVTKAEELLALLPDFVDNLEEAETLLEQLREVYGDSVDLDIFKEEAKVYSSEYDAFNELYEGSVDDFRASKNESYHCSFSSYGEFYSEWLVENCEFYCYLADNKFIIIH